MNNNYNTALRISVTYFILSSLWILVSDRLMVEQTLKGIVSVSLSSLLIYMLTNKSINKINIIHEEHQQILEHINSIDKMTGLFNITYAEKIYKDLKLQGNDTRFVFLYIDIDNFTNINDLLGFSYGDMLIKELGCRLKTAIDGNKGVVARNIGDEFLVVVEGISSKKEIENIVKDIQNIISYPIELKEEKISLSSTIGISLNPKDGTEYDTLMKKSHIAMIQSKSYNKSRYVYYDEKMEEKISNNIVILSDIRKGLVNDEFKLYYQIIKDVKSNKIILAEALIRWFHPKKGYIPPLDFIPIAEQTGLMSDISDFVVNEAFSQKKSWNDRGLDIPAIGINISAKSFSSYDFIDILESKMEEYDIGKGEIVLELTESGFLEDDSNLIVNIEKLRSLGVEIALDDFGTGYSTPIRLKSLPIDYLKIDKGFIDNVHCNSEDEAMVSSFVNFSRAMGIKVIAEGIERQEQIDKLLDLGCILGQGYHIAKPMSADNLETLYKQKGDNICSF